MTRLRSLHPRGGAALFAVLSLELKSIKLATTSLAADRHFLRRRLVVFLGEALRAAAALATAKSSSLAPASSFSRNHTGWAPRPAHVLPALSRYLIGTFRPFSELCPRAQL